MNIKFVGGPWDSVEINADYAPDVIVFRHMAMEATKSEQLGIPQEDPDNPEYGNILAAIVDGDAPIELQAREHFYRATTTKTGTLYELDEDGDLFGENIPMGDDNEDEPSV